MAKKTETGVLDRPECIEDDFIIIVDEKAKPLPKGTSVERCGHSPAFGSEPTFGAFVMQSWVSATLLISSRHRTPWKATQSRTICLNG